MGEDVDMEYVEDYLLELVRELDGVALERTEEQSDHSSNEEHSNSSSDSNATTESWGSDEPPPLELNYEALKHIATQFLPGSHGACIDITEIHRGSYHEVRVLHFEDGWTCIARFTRDKEPLLKTQCELATVAYVRKHTDIPVPETYFVNYNENHVVGAPFVLMEKMEGDRLNYIWFDLPFEHKLSIVEQTANIVGKLADLQFDKIGSFNGEGAVGPFLNVCRTLMDDPEGPFPTTLELFYGALNEKKLHRPKSSTKWYPAIKELLEGFMEGKESDGTLQAPYRLIHDDLELYNILVRQSDKNAPPQITGVIDWDWAYVGPLYYLCEYPPSILECHNQQAEDDELAELKKLRKHFVKTIAQRYPKGSVERADVKRCFKEKSDTLNWFMKDFAGLREDREVEEGVEGRAECYLLTMRGDRGEDWPRHPYGYCYDYEPDSDPESDDE